MKCTNTVVTKKEISHKDQRRFLYHAGNMFVSAVKSSSVILTVDSSSAGHLEKCSFWYFLVGLIFQPQSLELVLNKAR